MPQLPLLLLDHLRDLPSQEPSSQMMKALPWTWILTASEEEAQQWVPDPIQRYSPLSFRPAWLMWKLDFLPRSISFLSFLYRALVFRDKPGFSRHIRVRESPSNTDGGACRISSAARDTRMAVGGRPRILPSCRYYSKEVL